MPPSGELWSHTRASCIDGPCRKTFPHTSLKTSSSKLSDSAVVRSGLAEWWRCDGSLLKVWRQYAKYFVSLCTAVYYLTLLRASFSLPDIKQVAEGSEVKVSELHFAHKVLHPFIFLCLCSKQLVNLSPNRLGYLGGYQGYAIWGWHHHVSQFCFSKCSLSLWPDGEQAVAVSSRPQVNTAFMTVDHQVKGRPCVKISQSLVK